MHANFNKRHKVSSCSSLNFNITRVSEYRQLTSQCLPNATPRVRINGCIYPKLKITLTLTLTLHFVLACFQALRGTGVAERERESLLAGSLCVGCQKLGVHLIRWISQYKREIANCTLDCFIHRKVIIFASAD